ncbi:hypothetical protein PO124_06920 [Bacillus licheniformis]|nr:hypothetical protein [Bacillus licheniformis]
MDMSGKEKWRFHHLFENNVLGNRSGVSFRTVAVFQLSNQNRLRRCAMLQRHPEHIKLLRDDAGDRGKTAGPRWQAVSFVENLWK